VKRKGKAKRDESLLAADAAQGLLLDLSPHPLEAEARVTKRCTGQLLFERDRKVYDDLLQALAAGKSVRYCMRTWGLGTHTVLAIARRERLEVATRKGALADAMLLGAEVYAERALELADSCEDAYQAAGTAKMLAETSNLMRGQATSIMGAVVVHVDANAMAARLAEKVRQIDLEAGDSRPLGAGRAAARADGLGQAGALGAGSDLGALDVQATVSRCQSADYEVVKLARDTLGDTEQGAVAAGRAADGDALTGGGGGRGPAPVAASISFNQDEIL
jgi:hypothetical protein